MFTGSQEMIAKRVPTFVLDDYISLIYELNRDYVSTYQITKDDQKANLFLTIHPVSFLPPSAINVSIEQQENGYVFSSAPLDSLTHLVISAKGKFTVDVSENDLQLAYEIDFDDLPIQIENVLKRTLKTVLGRVKTFLDARIVA